jgi:hypothetical protein
LLAYEQPTTTADGLMKHFHTTDGSSLVDEEHREYWVSIFKRLSQVLVTDERMLHCMTIKLSVEKQVRRKTGIRREGES